MLFESFGNYVICDGAMGTMLQKRGLESGKRSDLMTMTAPHSVEEIHRLYVEAGSDIIYTNTFGANSDVLQGSGYTPEDVINTAISLAKRAGVSSTLVALNIGPIGVLMEPIGKLTAEHAYALFKEQAVAGEKAGADLVAIETMGDISELEAAVSAVKENTSLPVIATMSFDKTGRTYMGYTPEDLAENADEFGLDAVGINCSLIPAQMFETVERLAKASSLPLVLKPNAGMPDASTGDYTISPVEFAEQIVQLANVVSGAKSKVSESRLKIIIGGCCGTTPDFIREIRKAFA